MASQEDPYEATRSSPDHFTFLFQLGSGSWGTVWLARRHLDGQEYAIKQIPLYNRKTKDQLAAVQEAQVGCCGAPLLGA